MQKILYVKPERNRSSIPLLGKQLHLVEVTGVSAPEGDESIAIYPFKDSEGNEVELPSSSYYAFGYYTEDNMEDSHIFKDLDSFGELFDLNSTDTEILTKFIMDTAYQLKLVVVPTANGIVVVNGLINEMAKQGCSIEELENMKGQNRDVALGMSGAGAATLLGEIVKTGMGRYNKINLDDKVQDIVDIIKSCKFIDDNGDCKPVTLTGVESIMKRVKDKLFISSND